MRGAYGSTKHSIGFVRTVLLGGLALGGTGNLRAQQVTACDPDLRLAECWRSAYDTAFVKESAQRAAKAEQALRLFGQPTGLGDAGSGLPSAIADFLPLFAGAPTVSSADESDLGFGFELNLPLYGRPGDVIPPLDLHGTVQLRAEANQAEVFPTLVESVPEASRPAVREALLRDLDHFDNLTFKLTWNAEGRRLGRSFGKYGDLLDTLLEEAVDQVPRQPRTFSQAIAPLQGQLDSNIDSTRRNVQQDCVQPLGSTLDVPLDCFTESFRIQLTRALIAHAQERRQFRDALSTVLQDTGLFRVAELINNQPQLSVSAEAKVRSGAVGPDSYALGARYEKGFANMNAFQGYCRSRELAINGNCLAGFLAEPGVTASLKNADRIWASVDAVFTQPFDFGRSVAGAVSAVDLEEAFSVRAELGYGRSLRADATGGSVARIDFSVSGELTDRASARNDRLVASLTYTQKISDTVTLPLGISFANKPEFLGGADDQFGMHVGVRYRLQRDPEEP